MTQRADGAKRWDMIGSILIDIETFSSVDLAKSGVYRYAEAPDFRILLFGYSVNGEKNVHVVDLDRGETIPAEIMMAIMNPETVKWAFNAAFERVCLSRYFRDLELLPEGCFLNPEGWDCLMVRCAMLGYPLSLEAAGSALGLEKQKLTEGRDLIRFFCKPVEPTLLNRCSDRNTSFTDPVRWERFKEYNRRDVEAEGEILERALKMEPEGTSLYTEYEMDQVINDRGILVDERIVRNAVDMDDLSREELTEKLSALTSLDNPNSVSQIRVWLADHGKAMESLGKKQVASILEGADPEIREVLLLRQQLAKSSVKKYRAMADAEGKDGRIRGMFQFYGAPRSGRWAGRGVQLQNLPQNHLPDLDEARKLVKNGDYETARMLYDSVPDMLSELIRTAFIPAKGKKFIVADFSAIEARVIAWLAGEAWRMKVFAEGGDIYCASATQMFHVPVVKHGVNGHLRQKGKIAELALGYGGGAGALKAMGALEMGVTAEELLPLVQAWRRANPAICDLWWNVDKAVKKAVREKTTVKMGRLYFVYASGMLFIHLPANRVLCYAKPWLEENDRGSVSVKYMGLNTARKWDVIESYGPKFVENIVQGIARDLLANAMIRLEKKGYRIVAHVHDEVIIEAEKGDSVDEVCRIMSESPSWAEGLILRADGYECDYYRKD